MGDQRNNSRDSREREQRRDDRRGSSSRSSSSTGSKRPTHEVFVVRDVSEEKSFWERIGVGWENRDGDGINVELYAFPVGGKLTIRKRKPRDDRNADPESDGR